MGPNQCNLREKRISETKTIFVTLRMGQQKGKTAKKFQDPEPKEHCEWHQLFSIEAYWQPINFKYTSRTKSHSMSLNSGIWINKRFKRDNHYIERKKNKALATKSIGATYEQSKDLFQIYISPRHVKCIRKLQPQTRIKFILDSLALAISVVN